MQIDNNTMMLNSIINPDPIDPSELRFGHPDFISFYKDIPISWVAMSSGAEGSWLLSLIFPAEGFLQFSVEEIHGLMKESGFDLQQEWKQDFIRFDPDPSEIFYRIIQILPETPPYSYEGVAQEDADRYKMQQAVILTLDAEKIRKVMDSDLSDEDIIVAAHKYIAHFPLMPTSRKIESVKWLHRHGFCMTDYPG